MANAEVEKNLDNSTEQATEQAPKKKNEEVTFSSILILILVLIALLSIPIAITKFNILGAGEKLRPILKTNSIFRSILPPVKDPKDTAYMNREQLIKVADDLQKKVKILETQLNESKRVSEVYTGSPDGFQQFDLDKAQLEAQKKQLQKEKDLLTSQQTAFAEKVKNEDQPSFREYYETINPDVAKKLYQEIVTQEQASTETKAFVEYYEKMDAASAAKIFEQISKSDINLVANIIKNMDKTKGSKVLQAMDPKVSSRVTDLLAKQTPISR